MGDNIKESIISEFIENEKKIKLMGGSVHSLINQLIRIKGINTHSISYRVKEMESLKEKISVKNKYKKLSEITDILGVRIITYYADDIDKIEEILREEFEVDEENSIDKRRAIEPNRFGYMSLHYIVKVGEKRKELPEYVGFKDTKFEIQIRTILQHAWAEIEHEIGYKSKQSMPRDISRMFSILSGTLELVDLQFMGIKDNIEKYKSSVYSRITHENEHDIELNTLSLKSFLESDKTFDKLYQEYKTTMENCGFESANPQNRRIRDSNYESAVVHLESIGIKTIKDIRERLLKDDNVKIAINYTKKYKSEMNLYVIKYTFLMYLIYMELSKNEDYKSSENLKDIQVTAIGRFRELMRS